MVLTCKTIDFSYNGDLILENLQLKIETGEFCCIVGPSGCGKSTLLRIMAGILKPKRGTVQLDENVPSPKNGDIGFVFQEDALFPWLTVGQNIEFGLKARGTIAKDERQEIISSTLAKVGLNDYIGFYPKQLSGGMKQRVSIARVLAYKPKILLMDEPFAALDAINRNHLQRELSELWLKEQKTIIFVTHNVDEAVYLADRVAILDKRPTGIKKIIQIDLPRPRDRTFGGFIQYRREILGLL